MKPVKLEQWMKAAEGMENLNREAIGSMQLKKINRLLKREKERGGFYKNFPERIEDLEEFRSLPFTTQEDLLEKGASFVLVSQSQIQRVRTQETSGTTGRAKRIYYSAKDNERTVTFFQAGLSELVCPGEKTLICMPFSGGWGLGELIAEAIRRIGALPLEGGVGKTYGELLEILRREKPETFVGMPVPLLSLLRLEERCSIKRALISADFCPDTVCREIENLLGTRLYPHYGSREIGLGGAVTCQAFEGMHIRENDIYPEIIDKEGRVLPDGEWGELVITTMEAEAMPLIRYRTGDRTRILKEPCPCGSCITRIDRLRRMGKENPMEELDELIFREKNVIDYQGILKNGEIYIKGYKKEETEVSGLPEKIGEYPLRFEWTEVKERFTPCYPAKRRLLTGEEL